MKNLQGPRTIANMIPTLRNIQGERSSETFRPKLKRKKSKDVSETKLPDIVTSKERRRSKLQHNGKPRRRVNENKRSSTMLERLPEI